MDVITMPLFWIVNLGIATGTASLFLGVGFAWEHITRRKAYRAAIQAHLQGTN